MVDWGASTATAAPKAIRMVASTVCFRRLDASSLSKTASLRLPKSARAALAARLLESLDSEIDEDAEEAWDAEIARRLDEINSGRVKMIPWSEARRQIMETSGGRQ